PTLEPTQDPTQEPTQEPTLDPTQDPTQTSTQGPGPTQPPTYDLDLTVTATTFGPLRGQTRFDITTEGYPPDGGAATLKISWRGLTIGQLPTGCSRTIPASGNSATCPLSRDNPSVHNGTVVNLPTATVDFTVTADDFTETPTENNNFHWSAR
ncbi:MAG: hypothetical protein L0H93_12255, partial [Nocardioides sp.]|nr:hypothetical protein [Nocardioides sp.]